MARAEALVCGFSHLALATSFSISSFYPIVAHRLENEGEGMSEKKIPEHVAIIMDGNGRWARLRGLSVSKGHEAGAETAKKVASLAKARGIKYLTLNAFSSENWKREREEREGIFSLVMKALTVNLHEFEQEGARLCFIGDRSRLPTALQILMRRAEERTKDNGELVLTVALSYGARADIAAAAARIAARGQLITEEAISLEISTTQLGIPEPGVVIRTGGKRLSNFFLWEASYSEIVFFPDLFWPDFTAEHLDYSLDWYASRERTHGGRPNALREPASLGVK